MSTFDDFMIDKAVKDDAEVVRLRKNNRTMLSALESALPWLMSQLAAHSHTKDCPYCSVVDTVRTAIHAASTGIVLLLLLSLVGCGGGPVPTITPPVALKKPAKPPKPPDPSPSPTPVPAIPPLPASWTAVDLPPLLGADAAQANAINAAGHAVGYSVTAGVPTATLWENSVATSLWPGVASAINDQDIAVGYRYGDGFTTIAVQNWTDIPLVSGFDSSLAMGINNSGVVVGIAYNSANTAQQAAWSWSQKSGLQVVPGCQAALAINDGGTIAGIATDFNAAVCGVQEFSVGAVTSLNKSGQAVGYSNNDGFVFPGTDLGTNSSATGINDYGWVIGESFTPLGAAQYEIGTGNSRSATANGYKLSVVSHYLATVRDLVATAKLSGVSHPFIWTQSTGIVPLQGIVTANGINLSGQIVGATVLNGQVRGVLLQP